MSLIVWVRVLVLGTLGVGLSTFTSGCGLVTTDKPLYRPSETIFDPQLLGIWACPKTPGSPTDILVIVRGQGRRYQLSSVPMQPSDPSSRIEMDLIRLGKYEYLFMDLPGCTGTLLFPAYRVRVSGRELRMSLLNEPQFVEELRKDPSLLQHTEQTTGLLAAATTQPVGTARPSATSQPTTWPVVTNIVLTDTPEKIRELLVRHEDDLNWFAEVLVLQRLTHAARH